MSLPSWECGLKFLPIYIGCYITDVAPLVGVWIEIINSSMARVLVWPSLPSWECGLK